MNDELLIGGFTVLTGHTGSMNLFVISRWAAVFDPQLGTCNSLLVYGGLCGWHSCWVNLQWL